jgi:transposase
MAFEMGEAKWRLAFATGMAERPRQRQIVARDLNSLMEEIRAAKARFGLPEDAKVVSCYEAGRDGFWLHRFLASRGVENHVLDSASIEVDRRKRRAKTDRLDAEKLLRLLIRWSEGDKKACRTVQVPAAEDEDARQLHRELEELKREQTSHRNRIKGLFAQYGVSAVIDRHFPARLKALRTWEGKPLPEDLINRLLREFQRMQQVNAQIRQLEKERSRRIREQGEDAAVILVRKLLRLRAIGMNFAWMVVRELFAWRRIKNRRQLGALVGLIPMPYSSGNGSRDQGISKAGNRRIRAMLVEIAWCWLRLQPQSELTQWFQEHFGGGSKRLRRIGIVAVGRKLMVALWKYLVTDEVPRGAQLVEWEDKLRQTAVSLS